MNVNVTGNVYGNIYIIIQHFLWNVNRQLPAIFINDETTSRHPAFWDGGRAWKICFASPLALGRWTWPSYCSIEDAELVDQSGQVVAEVGPPAANRVYRHGFWRMSSGRLPHALGEWIPDAGGGPRVYICYDEE